MLTKIQDHYGEHYIMVDRIGSVEYGFYRDGDIEEHMLEITTFHPQGSIDSTRLKFDCKDAAYCKVIALLDTLTIPTAP